MGARPNGLGHSRARTASSAREASELDGRLFEKVFSGLDAGGLLDGFDPPSVAALDSDRGLRSAASAANGTSAPAFVSPLDARPVSLALSQPRSA